MRWITPVDIAAPTRQLTVEDRFLLLGSCFADEMAERFARCQLPVTANPFGTLYNPLSIAQAIALAESAQDGNAPLPLVEHGGLWHAMSHHGAFSAPEKEEAAERCRASIRRLSQALREASVVIVTFGTAWVYEYGGKIVANCHKLPASDFVRQRLTEAEIVETWLPIVQRYSDKQWLFTVSPIRHIRDGLHENTLSKSVLQLAVARLMESTSAATYFPAYEIVVDELRDYRFYAEDLVHPSHQAVEYVWERFTQTCFSTELRHAAEELHALWLDEHHRVLHPDSAEALRFAEKTAVHRAKLAEKYTWLNSQHAI